MFIKRILIILLFLGSNYHFYSQNKLRSFNLDAQYFRGSILLHDKTLLHLKTGHPNGFILSLNKFTDGKKPWHSRYNYPDVGISLVYQNYANEILGQNISINGHYNFYFLNRKLILRLGHGVGYATNPFDKIENPKNIAISTRLTSSTLIQLNYNLKLFENLSLNTGLTFTHHSIGNIRAPNKGINTIALNTGIIYDFNKVERKFEKIEEELEYSKKINFNLVLRGGANESDIVGSGRFPFFVISGYVDRKISMTNSLQFGTDVFFSYFLKESIKYDSVIDEGLTDPNTDFKRIGIFAGHELFIGKLSFITHVGFYAYYPYDYADRVYFRVGFKYYLSDKIFGVASLKSHGADAEAFEFGLGIKL